MRKTGAGVYKEATATRRAKFEKEFFRSRGFAMRERPIAETDITAVLGLLEALPENDVHSRIKRSFENGRRETQKMAGAIRWTILESGEDVDVLIADISHLLKYGGPTNERRESLNRVVAHLHAMK